MKIKLVELEANPYRKNLGTGYDEHQIKKLIESFKMSDYGEDQRFEVRKNNGKYELVYGHHRKEALVRHYGKSVEVEIKVRNYTDDQMLVEMLRENMTKDNEWFAHMQAFQATKKYLEERPELCKAITKKFENQDSRVSKRGGDRRSIEVGSKTIARFLSTDEETVSEEEVRQLLKMGENLAPELLKEVEKNYGKIGLTQLKMLSDFKDHEEQKDLKKALERSREQRVRKQSQLLTRYKEADEDTKTAVRKGELDLIKIGYEKGISKEGRKINEEYTKAIQKSDINVLISVINEVLHFIKKQPLKNMPDGCKKVMTQTYAQLIKILNSELEGKAWEIEGEVSNWLKTGLR